MTRAGFIALVLSAGAFAQSFDVASIKPSPPPTAGARRIGGTGGPGTKDPGLYTCTYCTIGTMVTEAYNIKRYQLSSPAALEDAKFEISARVPEGTTKEQFRLMLQNLLAERFKMTVHREKREMPVYDLVVGKNGPKLRESAPLVPPATPAPPPPPMNGPGAVMERDKDGFPVFPMRPGSSFSMSMMPGKMRLQAASQSMEQLAALLTNQLGKPVTDETGLKAKYEFTLVFAPEGMSMGFNIPPPPPGAAGFAAPAAAPEASEPVPNIFSAIQQLGLKLEAKKGLIDTVVVDHAEKTPTEN